MKVVIVNDKLDPGGAEKMIVTIASLLHEQGVNVQLVLFLKEAVLDKRLSTAIPRYYLHRNGRVDFKAMRSLQQLVLDADILHVHSLYNLRYLLFARLFFPFRKPKLIFHEHFPRKNSSWITKFCYKQVNAFVGVEKDILDMLAKESILPVQKLFHLPNVVNNPPKTKSSYTTGSKIIMVGNFWHPKNHLFALEVMKKLPGTYTLDMYGIVKEQEYFMEIQKKVAEYQLESRVQCIHGITDIYAVLNQYDLAIHTSVFETGPLVLIEYMKFGLPFVTSDTGDVVRVLKTAYPQIVMSNFEAEEWSTCILKYFRTEEFREHSGSLLMSIAQEHYSEQHYVDSLLKIYNTTLSSV